MRRRRAHSWLTRASVWLIRHIPPPLVSDTERIGLSLAFVAVGGLSTIFLINQDIRPALYPVWMVYSWTIALIIGGSFTIVGIWRGSRQVERFGMMMAAIGCLTYGTGNISAGLEGGPRRLLITGILFVLFAVIKVIRLAASTAASATVNSEGSRE